MSEQVLDPTEVQEELEPSFDEQVVEAFDALHPEPEDDPEEVVASTDPEVEAPGPHEEQEPTSESDPALEQARRIRDILAANPELAEKVVALERGDVEVIPRQVLEAAQRYQAPPEEDPDQDLYSDPFAVIKSLQERVENFENQTRAQQEARRQREWSQNTSIVEQEEQKFFQNHPELSEHRMRLFDTIGKTQLIRTYRERYNGDNRRAVAEALEAAYRIEFPDAAVAQAQRRVAREAQAKRRAGAAAASPRSMPRNQPEEKLRNSQDRVELFADIIREEMDAQR